MGYIVDRRKRRRLGAMLVCAVLTAVGAAAAAAEAPHNETGDTAGPADVAAPAVTHVVAISVDALNPDAIRQLGRERVPNFYRMIDEGAGTLNARTIRTSCSTLPNHVSMVTGREKEDFLGYHGHHVRLNNYQTNTIHDIAGERVASVLSVVHDAGGRTAFYSPKPKFELFDRSWNQANGARDRVGPDNGRDKIDVFVRAPEATLVADLRQRLRDNPPAFSFLHLAQPDHVGHATHDFMGPEYLDAVEEVDGMLGRVFRRITNDPGLARHTTVLLVGDHGGLGDKHTPIHDPDNYTVPFLTWGAGVASGADLYDLNGDRQDPGTLRPDYDGVQPVRNAEIGNLATDLLGMPPIGRSQMNNTQTLDVR